MTVDNEIAMISQDEAGDLIAAVEQQRNVALAQAVQFSAALARQHRLNAGKDKKIAELEAKLVEAEKSQKTRKSTTVSSTS